MALSDKTKKWLKWGGLAFLALLVLGGGGGAVVAIKLSKDKKERLKNLWPAINAASQETGIPADWLAALALHESGLNPYVVTPHVFDVEAGGGGYGLLQLNYQTAKDRGYTGPAPTPPPGSMIAELQALGRKHGVALRNPRTASGAYNTWKADIPKFYGAPDAVVNEATGIIKKYLDKSLGGSATGGWTPYRIGEGLLNPATQLLVAARKFKKDAASFGMEFKNLASAWNSGRPYASAPDFTKNKYIPESLAALDQIKALRAA